MNNNKIMSNVSKVVDSIKNRPGKDKKSLKLASIAEKLTKNRMKESDPEEEGEDPKEEAKETKKEEKAEEKAEKDGKGGPGLKKKTC
jgi:hypothetical protein